MQTRDRIHHLVDALPEQELSSVEQFILDLGHGGDSLDHFLAQVPDDDEPETAEERAAVKEAYDDIAAG